MFADVPQPLLAATGVLTRNQVLLDETKGNSEACAKFGKEKRDNKILACDTSGARQATPSYVTPRRCAKDGTLDLFCIDSRRPTQPRRYSAAVILTLNGISLAALIEPKNLII